MPQPLRLLICALGTAVVFAASCVLSAQRPSPPPAGTWHGTLAGSIPIVVHIRESGGQWAASLDSPQQGAFGLPGASVVWKAPHFSFAVPKVNGHFTGTLTPQGTITGTWSQGGASLPLTLARGAYQAPAATPFVWPGSVRQTEIHIPTGPGEGELAGAITEPKATVPAGGWPGAVILAGSGPTDRNGDNPLEPVKTRPYEKLAAYLSAHGVAVLRFDKRGIGASAALHAPSNISRYATDARWAALRLARQPGVNPARIVLIGHSLGSTLALMAAAEARPALPASLAGIVSLEGAGRSMDAVLEWQIRQGLARAHLAPAVQQAAMAHTHQVLEAIVQGKPISPGAAGNAVALKALIAQRPFSQSFLALNPLPYARRDRVPTLIVQGGKDIQVTEALDAKPLLAAIPASTQNQLRVFPDMVHMLMDYAGPAGPGEASLAAGTPLDPGMERAVLAWIQDRIPPPATSAMGYR